MTNWKTQRKDLETAIVGLVQVYDKLIPKEMPISYWPKQLQEYHEQRLLEEVMPDSPAELARETRIDELRRNGSNLK